MRNALFTFILLSVSLLTFSQNSNSNTIKRINVNEFYVQTGFFAGPYSTGTLADFKTLAPNSVLLNSNLISSSQLNTPFFYHGNANSLFSAMLGFQFSDKQKSKYKNNIQLRVGITYSSNSSFSGTMNSKETKPFDTLTSALTGQTIFVDSVIKKGLDMTYSSEQLRLDAALIFRTNSDARWSLFSGLGVTAGISINAETQIHYSKYEGTETRKPNDDHYFSSSYYGSSDIEVIKNKNNFGFSAYIPLGIDFRIGKKREFWKRTHIFYELRPSINVTYIPELSAMTNTFVQHGLGIKVTW